MVSSYTLSDVAKHNSSGDCWIVVDGHVYDVTKFLSEHPGGKKVLLQVAGTDASKKYHLFHNAAVMQKWGPKLQIGKLSATQENSSPNTATVASPSSSSPAPSPVPSAAKAPAAAPKTPLDDERAQRAALERAKASAEASKPVAALVKKAEVPSASSLARYFGEEQVPFGDANWAQGWHSPYYKAQHHAFRAAMRKFVDAELAPHCFEWDEAKAVPRDIFSKLYKAGILPGTIGAPWPTQYAGSNIIGGIKPEQYDYFCELILTDELSRAGSGGLVWAIIGGLSIGLPPVLHFGSQYLKDKCCTPCVTGEKIICLAITEPYAGSDVANIQCEAKLSADGKHYIVNGEKKWITNGVSADFFTTAVRTGGPGMGGISMLLIERGPGVTTRQMKCQGVWASGTTYITFEDVKVPIANLIGKENEGFKYIMKNFNHERWGICVQASRFARVCLEESMRYAFKRKTFGKLLIEHPVIRLKLAHMARQVEATHALLESVTFQMNEMSFAEQMQTLAGPIALLKAQCTTVFEYCAREASQIFGGLAYTRGGQGEKVERLYREVRAYAIPGGSEEIMLDLGIRSVAKPYAKRISIKATL